MIPTQIPLSLPHMQWTPPEQGTIELNMDASFQQTSGRGWAGAVAKDYKGRVYLLTYCQLSTSGNVEEAEAQVALVGLHALAKVFRGPVELELDCKTVVEYLNSDVPTLVPCYGVIQIQNMKAAQSCFTSSKVLSARRSNTLVHEQAAKARLKGEALNALSNPNFCRSYEISPPSAPPRGFLSVISTSSGYRVRKITITFDP